MTTTRQCEACSRTLQPGVFTCECGAFVAADEIALAGDLDLPKLPGLDLPNVEIKLAALAPDFSLPGLEPQALLELPKTAPENLQLDFSGGDAARGRSFRPLLAIGKAAGGADVLDILCGLVQLPDGGMYIMDFVGEAGQARVQLFDAAGSLLRVVRQFEIGDAPEALDTPARIVADAQGNFCVADMGSSCVKQFTADGDLIATFGGHGTAENRLMSPQDMVQDRDGNLYIADTGNSRVLKWDRQGQCLLALGINQPDPDADWLLAGEEPGEFDGPQGVAIDAAGDIFVSDTNNHRVQQFRPNGTLVRAFGEEGTDAGALFYPDDIEVDDSGHIYVSDSNGRRIQKFDSEGHFIYQIILPNDAGAVGDFEVDAEGHILVALRELNVVLRLEVL